VLTEALEAHAHLRVATHAHGRPHLAAHLVGGGVVQLEQRKKERERERERERKRERKTEVSNRQERARE
jgi:hypothetical protein